MTDERTINRMTWLLEHGATMLASHHDCGMPLFRYGGEILCPVCSFPSPSPIPEEELQEREIELPTKVESRDYSQQRGSGDSMPLVQHSGNTEIEAVKTLPRETILKDAPQREPLQRESSKGENNLREGFSVSGREDTIKTQGRENSKSLIAKDAHKMGTVVGAQTSDKLISQGVLEDIKSSSGAPELERSLLDEEASLNLLMGKKPVSSIPQGDVSSGPVEGKAGSVLSSVEEEVRSILLMKLRDLAQDITTERDLSRLYSQLICLEGTIKALKSLNE